MYMQIAGSDDSTTVQTTLQQGVVTPIGTVVTAKPDRGQKVVNRSRGIFAIGQAVKDNFYQPSFYYNGVYINAQG